jgi:hypothetical protein
VIAIVIVSGKGHGSQRTVSTFSNYVDSITLISLTLA